MKKFAVILAASGLTLGACSSDSEPETEAVEEAGSAEEAMTDTQDTEEAESNEEGGSVSVDEGIFNVEVTIPASFFNEEEDLKQVAADAEAEDVKEATVNDDGSITYKMSKSQHADMLQEFSNNIDELKDDIPESGDYPSIQAVEASNNYDHFTVQVDQEAYENSFDGIATMTLGISGSYYQVLDGVDVDDYEVTIDIEDAETGEVFDTIVYPEALDEMGEE